MQVLSAWDLPWPTQALASGLLAVDGGNAYAAICACSLQ